MNELRVGTRELKNKLSEYLRRVKKGQTIIVTERGNVVAQISPPQQTIEERLWAMVEAGLADWNGEKPKPHKPKIINKSGKMMSDLIMEDRR
ncbi:MAG: type II toxin-antitoxin system prevent-host-death family antitoxin [Chloroflexota bacterium]